MKKVLSLYLLLLSFSAIGQIKTPAQLYPGLFEAVQMGQIYPDNKTFPDCTPLKSPKAIMALYNEQKSKPDFDLKKFVNENFAAPASAASGYHSDITSGIRAHIDTLWTVLQRHADTSRSTSLLPLPRPYIVPGGRFREVYYWDSYFTMLGLEDSRKYTLIGDIVGNFAYLIDTYGHIPNGNRSYYLTRSQPPFFPLMVEVLASHEGNKMLIKYRPEMLKEYAFWMGDAARLKPGQADRHAVRMPDGSIMNRYWDMSDQPREESYRQDVLAAKTSTQDPATFYHNIRAAAESGWDFSSRWFADGKTLATIQTTKIIPIDLNCLLYHMETVIAHSYQLSGNKAMAADFMAKAAARKKAINKYCWNAKGGYFTDYNWVTRQPSKQLSVAMASPLFFHIATQKQAVQVEKELHAHFLMPGGIASTLTKSGQQWDQPNGWAPLQYMSIEGVKHYGFGNLADTIATRWARVGIHNFNKTGKMMEKYDVTDLNSKAGGGEYPLQDGFGWSNGVLLRLMNEFKLDKPLENQVKF